MSRALRPLLSLRRAPLALGAPRVRTFKGADSAVKGLYPTLDEAHVMPRHLSELSGEAVFMLAELGEHEGAKRERLRREIMAVDKVDYSSTTAKILEMEEMVNTGLWSAKAPYQIGIVAALVSGWASIPLVFHYPTAQLFNDYCVTADPPELGAADTALEVGSWSWGWMEPPLGTISFFLLCMQFVRDQRLSLGQKPFTERLKEKVADRLVAAYPAYNERIVRAWAESSALRDNESEIAEEEARIRASVEANLVEGRGRPTTAAGNGK